MIFFFFSKEIFLKKRKKNRNLEKNPSPSIHRTDLRSDRGPNFFQGSLKAIHLDDKMVQMLRDIFGTTESFLAGQKAEVIPQRQTGRLPNKSRQIRSTSEKKSHH
jgi:hypothetical protein